MEKLGSVFIPLLVFALISSSVGIFAQSEELSELDLLLDDIEIQTPTLQIELDEEGDAKLSFIEPIDLDFDSVSGTISSSGNSMTASLNIEDALGIIEPDYSASLLVGKTIAQLDFQIYGDDIAVLISELGSFELNIDLQGEGSSLKANIDGHLSSAMMDGISELEIDGDALKMELQSTLDLTMAQLHEAGITSSEIVIESLSLDFIGGRIEFSAFASISEWKDLYASLVQYSSSEDDDEMMSCMGSNIDEIMSDLLNSELESMTLNIKGSGDMISVTAEDVVISQNPSIDNIAVTLQKSGTHTKIDASVSMDNVERLVSCLLGDYGWDGKIIESPVLGFEKSEDDVFGVVTLNGEIEGLANGGEELSLTIPSDITGYFEVDIEIPEDMEVKESSGIEVDANSIRAIEGASVSLKYGKKGLGFDNVFVIPLFVVVILFVLILYFRRR